jgi:Chlorite dismutase
VDLFRAQECRIDSGTVAACSRRAALRRLGAVSLSFSLGWSPEVLSGEEKPPEKSNAMNPRLFSFVGGRDGLWKVLESRPVVGESLSPIERLQIVAGNVAPGSAGAVWVLRGATSNERYVTRSEKEQLLARQPTLGRPEADCAVLIPIRKNAKWWSLTADERRQIFEERSHHNAIGLEYLPAIARRLHHCRDLTEAEPFDFLTWFEFAETDTAAFDRLLARLRASEEWSYVDREVEVRLFRGS